MGALYFTTATTLLTNFLSLFLQESILAAGFYASFFVSGSEVLGSVRFVTFEVITGALFP